MNIFKFTYYLVAVAAVAGSLLNISFADDDPFHEFAVNFIQVIESQDSTKLRGLLPDTGELEWYVSHKIPSPYLAEYGDFFSNADTLFWNVLNPVVGFTMYMLEESVAGFPMMNFDNLVYVDHKIYERMDDESFALFSTHDLVIDFDMSYPGNVTLRYSTPVVVMRTEKGVYLSNYDGEFEEIPSEATNRFLTDFMMALVEQDIQKWRHKIFPALDDIMYCLDEFVSIEPRMDYYNYLEDYYLTPELYNQEVFEMFFDELQILYNEIAGDRTFKNVEFVESVVFGAGDVETLITHSLMGTFKIGYQDGSYEIIDLELDAVTGKNGLKLGTENENYLSRGTE